MHKPLTHTTGYRMLAMPPNWLLKSTGYAGRYEEIEKGLKNLKVNQTRQSDVHSFNQMLQENAEFLENQKKEIARIRMLLKASQTLAQRGVSYLEKTIKDREYWKKLYQASLDAHAKEYHERSI